jgi:excisionase family DNA binding protein
MERLLLRVEEAAELVSLSRAKFAKLIADGTVPSLKIGRCRRIHVDALRTWLAEQRREAGDERE